MTYDSDSGKVRGQLQLGIHFTVFCNMIAHVHTAD